MLWLLVAGTLAAAMDAPVPGDLTSALAREASGDTSGALVSVEAVVQAWPNQALPRVEAARLLLKLGENLDRAEAHLEVAAAVAPENPRVHYLRGLLWEERGQLLRAARSYEQALFYRASYEDARFRVAGLWASLGDWLKAEMHYRLLSRSRPEWVQVRLQLIRTIEEQGREADAEKELLLLRSEQPGNALVLRRLAELYERTGRPQLAAKVRASLEPPAPPKKMRPLRPSRR
ncbi:tetratricopeptide repeat protein [Archangium violaceum]|uniref:tetratricopeptide repeat protein n=1 Tax=Archangium violaceum TaxID=83451 RepID=UPI00193C4A6C|nr:tetratricopeptide repeat protein [Archangium violaceum]QRK07076.1 tetratricopeptide repeat protein [Archangium violaceum]